MGQRETQLDSDPGEVGVTVDPVEEPGNTQSRRTESRTDRLRSRAASLFSPRSFLVTAVVALAGYLVIGGIPLIGAVTKFLGIAAGTFLAGAVGSESRYVESAAVGTAVAGGAALLNHLTLTVFTGIGVPLVALGALLGLLAGVAGHYFGRDLRAGLTRDI